MEHYFYTIFIQFSSVFTPVFPPRVGVGFHMHLPHQARNACFTRTAGEACDIAGCTDAGACRISRGRVKAV
jgi:hypothetical protein